MYFKRMAAILMVAFMLLPLSGCTDENSNIPVLVENVESQNNSNVKENNKKSKQDIFIEDISWSIDHGIIDGERYVVLSYVNNSKYTIAEFKIEMNQKNETTEDEKNAFFLDLQKDFGLNDEDINELRNTDISMHTESVRIATPGQTIQNVHCYYYSGYYYVRNYDHYSLVEPDIATIKYVKDNQIYTMYYDFTHKKYTFEESSEEAYYWTKTELGTIIPKPNVKVVKTDGIDSQDFFRFDAYGMTLTDFNAYVNECQKLGFDKEIGQYEGFYSAYNSAGYNVYLHYDKDDYSMSVTISAPKA